MNAPSSFQEMMDEILRDLDMHAVWYIDDILIYTGHEGRTSSNGIGSPHPTGSEAEHRWAVERVLQKLLDHNLAVNLAKSEFHVQEINFLGHILGNDSLRMEPGKIEAIQHWEVLTRKKEVQAFLGFANYYRRFIQDYASRVRPLTELTKGQSTKSGSGKSMKSMKSTKSKAPLSKVPFSWG